MDGYFQDKQVKSSTAKNRRRRQNRRRRRQNMELMGMKTERDDRSALVEHEGYHGLYETFGVSEADVAKFGTECLIGRPLDETVKRRGCYYRDEVGFEEIVLKKGAECLIGRPLEERPGASYDSYEIREAEIVTKGAEWLIGRPLDEKVKRRGYRDEIGFEEILLRKGAECLLGRPLEESPRTSSRYSELTDIDIVLKGAEWLMGLTMAERPSYPVVVDDDSSDDDSDDVSTPVADIVRMTSELFLGKPLQGSTTKTVERSGGLSKEGELLMMGAEWFLRSISEDGNRSSSSRTRRY